MNGSGCSAEKRVYGVGTKFAGRTGRRRHRTADGGSVKIPPHAEITLGLLSCSHRVLLLSDARLAFHLIQLTLFNPFVADPD